MVQPYLGQTLATIQDSVEIYVFTVRCCTYWKKQPWSTAAGRRTIFRDTLVCRGEYKCNIFHIILNHVHHEPATVNKIYQPNRKI